MTPLSICTIVKNEEKHINNFLFAIKKHLKGLIHETLIVDTGSTDDTLRLIEGFKSTHTDEKIIIKYFDWISDFSAAKNFAFENASYDIILSLDADEYISSFDISCIDKFSKNNGQGLGLICIKNHTNDGITEDKVTRLFSRKYFHYEGIIHEQLCPINSSDKKNDTSVISRVMLPIAIDHYGYVGTPEELLSKTKRNNDLLFKMLSDNPSDPYIYYQLGQSYAAIKDYENAYIYYGKGLSFDVDERLQYAKQMVVGYGYAMLETNRFNEALSFEGIYESFCDSADFLALMGLIYLRNNLIDKAYNEFEKATKIPECEVAGSNSYLSYFNMAIIDEALGNTEKAISLYKKCGSFPPALNRLEAL